MNDIKDVKPSGHEVSSIQIIYLLNLNKILDRHDKGDRKEFG
jgi:hypothetical protein